MDIALGPLVATDAIEWGGFQIYLVASSNSLRFLRNVDNLHARVTSSL
jgi:hypothetical protein